MLKLYLVRHGETDENLAGITQGQTCGTLSEKGKKQIQLLARRLKDEKFDLIVSSDLLRAVETTKLIAQHHSCPVEYTSDFRERSSGIYEGRRFVDYQSEYKAASESFSKNPEEFRPENGESMLDVYDRVTRGLEAIMSRPRPSTILVSAHGGSIGYALCHFLQKPLSEFRSFALDNTCVNQIFFSEDNEISHINLNCTAHLTEKPDSERIE